MSYNIALLVGSRPEVEPIASELEAKGVSIQYFHSATEALERLALEETDSPLNEVIVSLYVPAGSDKRFEGYTDNTPDIGLRATKLISDMGLKVIVIGPHTAKEMADRCKKEGAKDYVDISGGDYAPLYAAITEHFKTT